MTNWPIPGMPDLGRLLQAQTEVLTTLPETLLELNRAVGSLAQAVDATRDTMLAVQGVTRRIDRLLDEIEDPVLGVRPGLERLSRVLEDPVIERIPASLEAIERTVLPVAESADRTRARLAKVRGALRGSRWRKRDLR